MALKLVILAGGMGSRYGGLKQLDTFGKGSHTLIEYAIYDAKKAGFDGAVCIIRKDFEEEFKSRIGKHIEKVFPIEYAFQDLRDLPMGFSVPMGREKPWGTGHALLSAKNLLKSDNFVVINADDFYSRESYQVVADFMKDPKHIGKNVLVGYVLDQVLSDFGGVNRGIIEQDRNGSLKSIIETKNIQKIDDQIQGIRDNGEIVNLQSEALCSMNMIGFGPEALNFAENYFIDFLKEKRQEEKSEFYLPVILQRMVDDEGVDVPILRTYSKWFGVTYQEDKKSTSEAIDNLIAEGVYPNFLW